MFTKTQQYEMRLCRLQVTALESKPALLRVFIYLFIYLIELTLFRRRERDVCLLLSIGLSVAAI